MSAWPRASVLILHLGGGQERIENTVREWARFYRPRLPLTVFLSDGDPAACRAAFAPYPDARYVLDFTSYDTVTHFTATYDRVRATGARSIILSSDHHHVNPRALALARIAHPDLVIIDGSFHGTGMPTPEPKRRVWTDIARMWVWRLTGVVLDWPPARRRARKIVQDAATRAGAL